MAQQNYILPPPLGVSNDLYEAYPQKADTVFDTFDARFPASYTPIRQLPALPSTFAPSQTSAGTAIKSAGSTVAPMAVPTGAPAIVGPNNPNIPVLGNMSSSVADYFLRAVIIILGFIFVAVGLRALAPNIVSLK